MALIPVVSTRLELYLCCRACLNDIRDSWTPHAYLVRTGHHGWSEPFWSSYKNAHHEQNVCFIVLQIALSALPLAAHWFLRAMSPNRKTPHVLPNEVARKDVHTHLRRLDQ